MLPGCLQMILPVADYQPNASTASSGWSSSSQLQHSSSKFIRCACLKKRSLLKTYTSFSALAASSRFLFLLRMKLYVDQFLSQEQADNTCTVIQ